MITRTLVEHRERVEALLGRGAVIDVMLGDAGGAVLAEDLKSTLPVPPVPIAACDGYALAAADVAHASDVAPVVLPVTHDVSFDSRAPRRHVPRTAARVPSGAPLPSGADAVVPTSAVTGTAARVAVEKPVTAGAYVRPAGAFVAPQTTVVEAGTRLGPRQLALAASLGRQRVRVHPVPRVVVVAVGDELLDVGKRRHGGGVPDVDSHLLAGLISQTGARVYRIGVVPDDPVQLRSALEDQVVRADLIVTTGGLSDGRGDTVAAVLASLGEVEVVEVGLRPGSRHGLGAIEAPAGSVPVIALPGSPVAAAVAFEAYLRGGLRRMCGHPDSGVVALRARARRRWTPAPGVVSAIPVVLDRNDELGLAATPLGADGISLADLARADALAWMAPEGEAFVEAGDMLTCTEWAD